MTVNWSKSNCSWRDRDRQQRLQLKQGGVVIDFNDARVAWVGLLTLASLFLYVAQQFQHYAPEPYMDEFFHERQTRAYCNGQWGVWDDKITTPPGLYLVGTAVLRAVAWASGQPAGGLCAEGRPILQYLRPINAVFNLGTFFLMYRMLYRMRKLSHGEAVVQALGILLFPFLFFFGFVYYTDAGGLFCVVAMLFLARRGWHTGAAAVGAASLLFRQTNVVWVAYALGTTIVTDLQQAVMKKGPSAGLPDPSQPLSPDLLRRFAEYMWASRRRLVALLWPYLAPLGGFLAFLAWNGGAVVLGDKHHHRPVLHAAQLAYWLLATALAHNPLLPLDADAWLGLVGWVRRECGLVRFACLLASGAALLHVGTLDHPFLLADNRHYTFYLWRRVFARVPHMNLYLLPLYALAAHWVASRVYLGSNPNASSFIILGLSGSNSLTGAILALAAALALLPAHLLEPRYFVIPCTVALLEMPAPPHLGLTTLAFALVNLITIHVFLRHPFTWGDGSVARFMW